MYKFVIFALCTLATACTISSSNSKKEGLYIFAEELAEQPIPATEVVATPQVQQVPVTTNTQKPIFSSNKTYMAGMAKKLKKAASNSGITVKQNANQIIVTLPSHIAFGSHLTTLDAQTEPILADMARTIKEYDRTRIQIFGYTDNEGTVSDNKNLSLRQANEVSNFFRLNGIDINRIVVDGLGPENPVSNNTTEANRRRNRRVEITLINVQ